MRADGRWLFVDEAGRFFETSNAFHERFVANALSEADCTFLDDQGQGPALPGSLTDLARRREAARRLATVGPLDYLILVPTLRCNLSCTYCQVSRAAIGASNYDWTEDTLERVLALLDGLTTPSIKIEFQGGEATLRLDLVRSVIERCGRFAEREFVICTNLSRVDDDFLALADRDDVFISTSLDGDVGTHETNRTHGAAETQAFLGNLDLLLARYGPGKVSALPTIDPDDPSDPDRLIDSYVDRGLHRIFLRPINYHGFARKRHSGSVEQGKQWQDYHLDFVHRLIARNWADRSRVIEETYLSLCLRRIFQAGRDRHVDLRNPNPVGVDYIVIDYDGRVYPTDEARMLTRSRVVDLCIGDLERGWDTEQRRLLNVHSTNQFDPQCRKCAYQPFCGRDLIDDLARYGRIDVARPETAFCRRHMFLFDLLFDLIYSEDPAVAYSLARWLGLPGDSAQLAVRAL
jgi:His-Xaa-Ser system radical SAM maturase HxsB